jgi:mRNA-degrading endonuclease YafQ of YafQ-DinJ toxin-antitoxin module
MDRPIRKIEYNAGFERLLNRYLKRISPSEKALVFGLLEIFSKNAFDIRLKTHKLHGRMADRWAFSINRKDRIIFRFISGDHVLLLDIGDHDIYQ